MKCYKKLHSVTKSYTVLQSFRSDFFFFQNCSTFQNFVCMSFKVGFPRTAATKIREKNLKLPYWSLNGKFDWLQHCVLRFSIINRTTMVTFDPFALEAFKQHHSFDNSSTLVNKVWGTLNSTS